MRRQEQHLSDEELLLATDAELKRSKRTRLHLEACSHCRSRAAQFKEAIAELARAQRSSLDSELPPIAGPRAMLRAGLSEMSSDTGSIFSLFRRFSEWPAHRLAIAAALIFVAAAGFLALRNPVRSARFQSELLPERDIRPNRALTPGAVRQVSLNDVCSLSREEVEKQVSPLQRTMVFKEYGIPLDRSDKYEVDYLITPGIGGDDDIRNLWPEPYNAAAWNAHVKDALEERLHELVCSHQLDLADAQRAIATDWIAAYDKYVRNDRSEAPLTPRRSSSPAAISPALAIDVEMGKITALPSDWSMD